MILIGGVLWFTLFDWSWSNWYNQLNLSCMQYLLALGLWSGWLDQPCSTAENHFSEKPNPAKTSRHFLSRLGHATHKPSSPSVPLSLRNPMTHFSLITTPQSRAPLPLHIWLQKTQRPREGRVDQGLSARRALLRPAALRLEPKGVRLAYGAAPGALRGGFALLRLVLATRCGPSALVAWSYFPLTKFLSICTYAPKIYRRSSYPSLHFIKICCPSQLKDFESNAMLQHKCKHLTLTEVLQFIKRPLIRLPLIRHHSWYE